MAEIPQSRVATRGPSSAPRIRSTREPVEYEKATRGQLEQHHKFLFEEPGLILPGAVWVRELLRMEEGGLALDQLRRLRKGETLKGAPRALQGALSAGHVDMRFDAYEADLIEKHGDDALYGQFQLTDETCSWKFAKKLKKDVLRARNELFKDRAWGEFSTALFDTIETALEFRGETRHEWRARWVHWHAIKEQTVQAQLALGVEYKGEITRHRRPDDRELYEQLWGDSVEMCIGYQYVG